MGDDPVQILPGRLFAALFQGMEQIELKNLFLVGQGPVEGYQAETGEMAVFREVLLKGGEQFPGFDEGIGGGVGGQQALLDVDVFQEVLEDVAVPDGRTLVDVRQSNPPQIDFGEILQLSLLKE